MGGAARTGRLPVRGRTGNFEPSATPYLRCVSRHGKSQPCLSGCDPQPLALVFGHARGCSPAWRSSAPTIASRVSATFSRRRRLRDCKNDFALGLAMWFIKPWMEAAKFNLCLSGCNPQPLGLVFGHAHGRSPAWRSSAPTIAPRISATFSRRRGLRRLLGEDSLERRVHLPPLSGGGRAVPLR